MPAQDIASSALASAPAGAFLTIDLDALVANYLAIRELAKGSEVAGVVKARAYGLGLAPVARALWGAGCRTFCVATAGEGATLRGLLPDATIYILSGLIAGAADAYEAHGLRPCLSSLAEVEEWRALAKRRGRPLSAGLQFETGLNRLGIAGREAERLISTPEALSGVDVTLVMSHLGCADEADHPLNRHQLERFRAIRDAFPGVTASLANSAGVHLGAEYHFDLVRPGIALYGGNPFTGRANPCRPVVGLQGRILDVREVASGETVGYGAAFEAKGPSRIAVIAMGYGDGFFRALGSDRQRSHVGGRVHIAGHYAPIAGRISMDLISIDVTELSEGAVRRGDLAELIGPHVTLDEVATRAGTIGYEVLTNLGDRYKRIYTGAGCSTTES